VTEREIGLGLEDFYPSDHQASTWATIRTEEVSHIHWEGVLHHGKAANRLSIAC